MATLFTTSLFVLLLLQAPTPLMAAQPPEDGGAGEPVSAGVLIVIVATFFFSGLIFLVVRLVFLYSGCCDGGLDGEDGGQSGGACRPPPEGLTPEVIQGIPTYFYEDVKMRRLVAKGELECAVCLNEFQDQEALRLLLECDHVFHLHCVDPWLSSNATCPICRADVRPPTDNQWSELNKPNVSRDHRDHVAIAIG